MTQKWFKSLFTTVSLLTCLVIAGFISEPSTTPYVFQDLGHFPPMPTAEGNPVTVEGALLGRRLFYDPVLSRDSSFSCSSCHRQEFAFSDGPRRFSEGIDGSLTVRNTMPLFNLAWYQGYFWDGRAKTIEEQVFHPVRDSLEMDLSWSEVEERLNADSAYRADFKVCFGSQTIDSVLVSKAIGQFLRTLISNNSFYDKVLRGEAYFDSTTYAGFVMANDQSMAGCLHCHATDANALGTSGTFSNNGLDPFTSRNQYVDKGLGGTTSKASDIGKFKIPSLRNVGITAPYMHDGRFNTLEEVIDFYSEGVHASHNIDSKLTSARYGGIHLSDEEKRCLITYLHTLTDSTFLTNPAFGPPKAEKY